MLTRDVFIAATGCWLPGMLPVQQAVRDGQLTPAAAEQLGLVGVRVAEQEPPPQMAAWAAEQALGRLDGGVDSAASRVDLLLHATMFHQGQDFWPAPSFIQRAVLGYDCPAVEVRQMSNGGMAALDLAAHYLCGKPDAGAALITAADRYLPPRFDRWRSDPGTAYGDGSAAAVLSTEDGWARIVGLASFSDAELERMHRGDSPFTSAPFTHADLVDLDQAKRDYLTGVSLASSVQRVGRGQRQVIEDALAQAGCGIEDVAWFVLPHLGRKRLKNIFTPLGIPLHSTTMPFLVEVGHLGPADQLAGLNWLAEQGLLQAGQLCMLLGVGAGFSWGAAVLRIERSPTELS